MTAPLLPLPSLAPAAPGLPTPPLLSTISLLALNVDMMFGSDRSLMKGLVAPEPGGGKRGVPPTTAGDLRGDTEVFSEGSDADARDDVRGATSLLRRAAVDEPDAATTACWLAARMDRSVRPACEPAPAPDGVVAAMVAGVTCEWATLVTAVAVMISAPASTPLSPCFFTSRDATACPSTSTTELFALTLEGGIGGVAAIDDGGAAAAGAAAAPPPCCCSCPG